MIITKIEKWKNYSRNFFFCGTYPLPPSHTHTQQISGYATVRRQQWRVFITVLHSRLVTTTLTMTTTDYLTAINRRVVRRWRTRARPFTSQRFRIEAVITTRLPDVRSVAKHAAVCRTRFSSAVTVARVAFSRWANRTRFDVRWTGDSHMTGRP